MKLVNPSFFALAIFVKSGHEKNEPPAFFFKKSRNLDATNLPSRSFAVVQTLTKNKAIINKMESNGLLAKATGTTANMKGEKNLVRKNKDEFTVLKSRRAHVTASPTFLKNILLKIFMARIMPNPLTAVNKFLRFYCLYTAR